MAGKRNSGEISNRESIIIRDPAIEAGLQHLAAAAMPEGWMNISRTRQSHRTVSDNELTSLSALIVYVSHRAGLSEFRVERDLADRFGVANVKCLPSAHYDEAIRFLVDRVPAGAGA
ncbi:MAG: hypothetical protein AB7H77_03410 [Bdellovibrionales bacterium]